MRKAYIFIFVFIFSASSFSQKNEVSDKFVKNVFDTYANLPDENVDLGTFWEFIRSNNENYNTYQADKSKLAENTKLEFKEVVRRINAIEQLTNNKNTELARFVCGENYSRYIKGIFMEDSYIQNAYAYPNGSVYFTFGFYHLLSENKNMVGLAGVIGHEITHCVLKHAEIHNYSLKKKEKSNKKKKTILQSLAGAVVAGTMILHSESGASFTESDGEKYADFLSNSLSVIDKGFDKNTNKFNFSYGREQEIEADIVACLFLVWIKENPRYYMDALSLLEEDDADYTTKVDDTHPSIKSRIKILKDFLFSGYLYNTKEGETQFVPKWKETNYTEKYPDSKKAKKSLVEKVASNNRVFFSKGKYHVVPIDKIAGFLADNKDAEAVVINS